MSTFTKLETGHAVLRSRGVYKQAALYSYRGRLFAGWCGGFIQLLKPMQGTSNPNVTWDCIHVDFVLTYDEIGRYLVPEGANA